MKLGLPRRGWGVGGRGVGGGSGIAMLTQNVFKQWSTAVENILLLNGSNLKIVLTYPV